MSDITIRDAVAADLGAIQAIYAVEVLQGLASFEEVPPDVAEIARRREAVLERGLPYLVAVVEGRIAGYAYAGPFHTRAAYRNSVEDSVYVARDARGLGVGRALLGALIARCEADGRRQMIAVIGNSANAGSIALHRSLGFRDVGILRSVGFKLGQWVDTVYMQRPLGASDTIPPAPPRI